MQRGQATVSTSYFNFMPNIRLTFLRWLANWVKLVGNLVVLFAALFAAIERNFRDDINIPISPGLIGLSITYALEINQHLNYVLRNTSELETSLIAVERVKEYSETATEAPAQVDDHRPPDDWPSSGRITFNQYSTCYRKGLDLVLHDISVDILGGSKVAVITTIYVAREILMVLLCSTV